MHRAGVAARAILQNAETVDDHVDRMIPDQPRKRGCVHGKNGQFQIERRHPLRGRECPRDADHMKALRAQIVGDKASDQAGRTEHEDVARFHVTHVPPQNGFAIISHRMITTEPKPGMPNSSQR